MPRNMSHCRFENIVKDLRELIEEGDLYKDDLSESENKYRDELLNICESITEEFVNAEEVESQYGDEQYE